MSCSVYWKPVKNEGKYVGSGSFRDTLSKRKDYPIIFSSKDIPYLEGIRDCGYEEANILIGAIYEEETIEVFIE